MQSIRQEHHRLVGVTKGGEGTYWFEENQLNHQDAFLVQVVDTLGAGDVFHGAFALAIAEKNSIPYAIRFASIAAALKCRSSGGRAGIPKREEVLALIKEQENE